MGPFSLNMAAEIEEILSRLLVPDNNVIQEATQQLKEQVKNPDIVPALCTVIGSSQNAQVRQYAAVLLRRRIMKSKQWKALPVEVCQNIRQNLLQVLLQEPEKSVRKAVAQLVGTVAKHDLGEGRWPELFDFLQQYTHSASAQEREVGMYVLSTVSSVATEQLKPHLVSVMNVCAATLEDKENPMVAFHTIQTLTYMVPMIGSDELKTFQALVPKLISVVRNLLSFDEEKATEAMEVFDELIECEVSAVVPHIGAVIEFSLELGANKNLEDSTRVKALSLVSWLIRLKKKVLLKLKLVTPVLHTLFPIMCEEVDETEEDEEFDDAEAHTASSFAGQVVDTMSLHLPPEKFVPQMMQLVQNNVQNEDPLHRRAAYLAIAVSVEGCADHLRNKYLQALLQQVCTGVADPIPMVRNAALFAMGQFSEHLQPDISKYSSTLLPLLFEQLGKVSQTADEDKKGTTKAYYALEMFCENMGKDIVNYLPQLMEHLLSVLSNLPSVHVKELAISAIGATANAANEELVPYFPQIIEHLKMFLSCGQSEDQLKLQVQALDTLGVLARTIGKSNFLPLAPECVQLGMGLLAEATDPDLRRCIYGLFAAISTLLEADMTPYLQEMTRQMMCAIKSTEGITAHFKDEENQLFRLFDEEEDLEDEDDDQEVQAFSVENAYLEEKEDAVCALGELAETTGAAFMPYLEDSYKLVFDQLDYPATNIRKASATAVGQFCCAVAKLASESKSPEAQIALQSMLSGTVPAILKLIREDTDRQVVMTTLETFNEMLKKIDSSAIQASIPNALDTFVSCVRDILTNKTACQDSEDSDAEMDGQQAEFDAMVMENAGDLIPSLGTMAGGERFSPYFAGLVPELLKRLKKHSQVSDKSFAIGTLAETIHAIGSAAAAFVGHLYPVFMTLTQDEDDEVRSNAVYGVGVLAANGGTTMHSQYPQVLKELFDILNKESDRRVVDNICAAVCRLIWSHIDGVPMEQVFPVIVQCLPLKEDLEENATVYPCIGELFKNQHPVVLKMLPQLLAIFAQVLGTDQIKEDVQHLLVDMVRSIHQQNPDMIVQASSSLPQDVATRLNACLNTCNGN